MKLWIATWKNNLNDIMVGRDWRRCRQPRVIHVDTMKAEAMLYTDVQRGLGSNQEMAAVRHLVGCPSKKREYVSGVFLPGTLSTIYKTKLPGLHLSQVPKEETIKNPNTADCSLLIHISDSARTILDFFIQSAQCFRIFLEFHRIISRCTRHGHSY